MGQAAARHRQVFPEQSAYILASPERQGRGNQNFQTERGKPQCQGKLPAVPQPLLDAANEGGPNPLYGFGAGVLSFPAGSVENPH